MEMIKVLIASVTFTLYFVTFAQLYKKFKLDFKPFNCEACLPVYIAAIFLFLPKIVSDCVIVVFGSGVLSCIASRLISRL